MFCGVFLSFVELDKIIEHDEILERQQQAAYVQRLTQRSQQGYIIPGGEGHPGRPVAMPAQHEPLDTLPENYRQLLAESSRARARMQAPPAYTNMGAGGPITTSTAPPGPQWHFRDLQDRKMSEIEELLKMTEDRTRLMRQETERLAKLYPEVDLVDSRVRGEKREKVEDGVPATKTVRFVDTVDKARETYERQALKDLGQTIRDNLPKGEKWQEELLLAQDQVEKYLKAAERVAKGDKLSEPTIRAVDCPGAGGLPFRHDPVKRFALYKKEWAKHPAPGEKKRLDLRWKVREYMLRQDIPKLLKY